MNDSQVATQQTSAQGGSARWAELGPRMTRSVAAPSTSVAQALDKLTLSSHTQSFSEWTGYVAVAEVFDAALATDIDDGIDPTGDHRLFDTTVQVATRIAMSRAITQSAADRLLANALAMRDRLPLVGECLRDGVITGYLFQQVITRTELVDDAHIATIDAAIAARFRERKGSWSVSGVRNMVDRIVFRHDPDAVRERRKISLEGRSTWVMPGTDGMATLGGSMSAENARIADDAITRLAATACTHDRRTTGARKSDAMFALLAGDRFTCDCDRDDCDAHIPAAQQLGDVHGRIVIHVIADASTAAGKAHNPGFVDGHGVISADHVHDLLARDDSVLRPLGPQTVPHTPAADNQAADADTDTEGDLLDPHLPSDPYRPSTALDIYIRIRDGYCTIPGCDRPAWRGDLDHVTEFDHHDPAAGGQTCPDDLNTKCRWHHRLKTHTDWLDDQYTDADGHTRTEVISPEGIVFPGPAENNHDLFEGLIHIRFRRPDITFHTVSPPAGDEPGEEPTRSRPRTAAKHARRRAERRRNRLRREGGSSIKGGSSITEAAVAEALDDYDAPPF